MLGDMMLWGPEPLIEHHAQVEELKAERAQLLASVQQRRQAQNGLAALSEAAAPGGGGDGGGDGSSGGGSGALGRGKRKPKRQAHPRGTQASSSPAATNPERDSEEDDQTAPKVDKSESAEFEELNIDPKLMRKVIRGVAGWGRDKEEGRKGKGQCC